MKITKRPHPMDFGASNDEGLAIRAGGAALEAGAGDPHLSAATPAAEAVAPVEPPLFPPEPTGRSPAARRAAQAATPPAWPIYLAAFAVAVLWALGPIAFAVGYRQRLTPLHDDGFALAVFALLAIGPAVFVLLAAYMARQGQKLAAESRRAKAMAEEMLAPSLVAAAQAGDMAQAVRDEILRASAAADAARHTLLALRQALAGETEKLADATQGSVRAAQELSSQLGRERSEMRELGLSLDAQAGKIAEALSTQARLVAEASEAAGGQLRDADATLAARAAELTAAAGQAGDAARTAGEDLTRHVARLETAGAGVVEQMRAAEGGLAEQRSLLLGLSEALKADQQAFAAEAQAHAARLSEFIEQARLSATEMSERAAGGGEAFKQLLSDAGQRYGELAEAARAERQQLGDAVARSLETMRQAAVEQRAEIEAQARAAVEALARVADDTRDAAARHAASAREQVDHLAEAAFAAGQRANQVFEARLEEARALVEQSSRMVEQTGAAAAAKLEAGAAAARATLDELQSVLGDIEHRAGQLPETARGQAEQVRAAVQRGLDELMAHARRTAEEAQAIDAAFQERVRRNFEKLSEAVRLMGAVAAAPPGPLEPTPAPAPAPRPTFTASFSQPALRPTPESAQSAQSPAPSASTADAEEPWPTGLRPRLKLTPTATDEEFSAIFEAAGGKAEAAPAPAEAGEEGDPSNPWTWKDLLASLGGGEGEAAGLEAKLTSELSKMGVEPETLLPAPRIEEIAQAVQAGDLDGARQAVKRLAPAAIRRIVRRLFTDESLKEQVLTFLRRYQGLVDDAVVRDPEGLITAGLLGSEAGRLFLLLDAAAGDMV